VPSLSTRHLLARAVGAFLKGRRLLFWRRAERPLTFVRHVRFQTSDTARHLGSKCEQRCHRSDIAVGLQCKLPSLASLTTVSSSCWHLVAPMTRHKRSKGPESCCATASKTIVACSKGESSTSIQQQHRKSRENEPGDNDLFVNELWEQFLKRVRHESAPAVRPPPT
jgi:hypothetical protein